MSKAVKVSRKEIRWRLPLVVVKLLRSKGGPHSTKSGKRGYDRKRSKAELRDRVIEP